MIILSSLISRSCTYPGATIHGHITPVNFYYKVGGTVKYNCAQGYRLEGKPLLTCGEDGSWDAGVPQCVKK